MECFCSQTPCAYSLYSQGCEAVIVCEHYVDITTAVRPYVVDKGFAGQANHAAWWTPSGAQVVCPPRRNSMTPWPKPLRRWLASVRQSVETIYDTLPHTFRLDRERPHALSGLQA